MQQMTDRALKERIIGAAVLVTFVVLVVPVFLDGPSQDAEIVSESVTLPGQNPDERKQQTIVLERDRSEPVPKQQPESAQPEQRVAVNVERSTSTPEPPPPQPEPAPVQEEIASEPEVAEVAESTTGMFAVQLGSFSSQENAERLAADLRGQGYAAFLSRLTTGDGELHRVRVGPQKDRASAETVAADLSNAGHRGQVVPHP